MPVAGGGGLTGSIEHHYPPSKSAGKLLQLPPLEFTELHRLPSPRNRPENSFNYPPRIHGTSSTTPPPRNRAGKLLQLPPGIHGTSSTTPLEIGRKTPSTTPPGIHGTSSTTPPLEIGRNPLFQNPGYGPVNIK